MFLRCKVRRKGWQATPLLERYREHAGRPGALRSAYASPHIGAVGFGLPQRLPDVWTNSWPSTRQMAPQNAAKWLILRCGRERPSHPGPRDLITEGAMPPP